MRRVPRISSGMAEAWASIDPWRSSGRGSAHSSLRFRTCALPREGDKVVCRYTWDGTQQGDFFGVAATSRRVKVSGISIYPMAGGKIVEEWWLEDLLGLIQQLGAIPTPGQAQPVPNA
jgi:hypothetical protein